MLAFDLIALLEPDLDFHRAKLHLASHNGQEDPLTIYRAGGFEPWQAWQSRRNFERDFVVALIEMPSRHHWLFAGAYRAGESRPSLGKTRPGFVYDLSKMSGSAELDGRLVCRFERKARQSYLNAEAWRSEISVIELAAEPLTVGEFPGFKAVHLSKVELDAVVKQQVPSWRAALSSVCGVYLIADERTGKLYVGSASGEGGFWRRWSEYSETGHAGNVELRRLLRAEGEERAGAFRFSILETADIAAHPEDILRREAHWKRVLLSREHGWNAN